MCNMFICHLFKISYNRLQKGKEGMEMGATCAIRRLQTGMEATHVADRKATYLYVYVGSLYLYVNLVKWKRALPCLIIL